MWASERVDIVIIILATHDTGHFFEHLHRVGEFGIFREHGAPTTLCSVITKTHFAKMPRFVRTASARVADSFVCTILPNKENQQCSRSVTNG